jgi:MarR family 2-MHQ and catechol resistance regulon transcriptional repressor
MGIKHKGSRREERALNTYIKMLRAIQSVAETIDILEGERELSGAQFGALEALYYLGPLTQKQITKKILTSKSNVVAIVDALEQRRLVTRKRDQNDRRFINVHITPRGETVIAALMPEHVAAITAAFSGLTLSEQKSLGGLCKKLGLNQPDLQPQS